MTRIDTIVIKIVANKTKSDNIHYCYKPKYDK